MSSQPALRQVTIVELCQTKLSSLPRPTVKAGEYYAVAFVQNFYFGRKVDESSMTLGPCLYVALEMNFIHTFQQFSLTVKQHIKQTELLLLNYVCSDVLSVCPRWIKCLKCVSVLYVAFQSHQSKCIHYFLTT